jgi:hypothetical protein
MSSIARGLTGVVLMLLLLAVPAAPGHVPAQPGASCAVETLQSPPAKCCFVRAGYVGTCEVQPAEGETCGQILDYLNNPMSQGKSYCNNTALRGDWKSVPCEEK